VYFNGHPNDADVIALRAALRAALENVLENGAVETTLAVIKSAVSDGSWFVDVLKDHQKTQQEFKEALSWCERIAAWLSIKEHGVSQMPDMPAGQHAEIAHMRGLLGEMGRLAACNRKHCVEAPTRLEGIGMKDVYEAGRGVWNRNFWMSDSFVADKCAKVLVVCGDRLDVIEEMETKTAKTTWHRMEKESVKRKMVRMEKALRLAHREANEMSKSHDNDRRSQVYRQDRSVRFVAWLYSFIPIRKDVQRLFPNHEMKATDNLSDEMQKMTQKGGEYATDALAVALEAYVDAMQKYRSRHEDEWDIDYTKQESYADFEELVTVADRLEAVLAVCENELDGIEEWKMRVT
jgi:hypothetical protein